MASLGRLAADQSVALPPSRLMPRLRDYIESLLLANELPPTPHYIAMLIDDFLRLVALSQTGKPILYKKRNTLSLMFDVLALQSEMRIDSPDELVLGYTQSMMGFLLFNPEPKKIGMIGLGGGSLAKFCYRHLPNAAIAVAEIDPHVIAIRDQFHIPPDDERFQVHCMDGADFIQQTENRFDVLMIDGFDRNGQPPQLCSERFYDDCHQALTQDGIVVVNLLGDAVETQVLVERIDRAFNGAAVVIDALDALNKIVFACKGSAMDLAGQVLMSRIGRLEALHPMILRLTAQSILLQQRMKTLCAPPPAQENESA
ncbi:fused MFS/spermidine synthase [Massilia cavernae]|nr:fused MFS/spermidine synthase [Massilia cavernae]